MGKVTAKTELLTATGDDILYIVEDPAGTPASRKISVANLIGSDAVLEIIRDEVGDNVLQGDKGVTVTPSDVANTVTIATDGVLEDLDTLGPATTDGQIIVATGAGAFAYESGSTARASLGVTIGTHVQAWDENLDQIAALTPASSLMIGNGAGAWTTVTPASFITNNNILDTADIGSSVQAHGAVLDDLNTLGAPTTDGQFLVATGAGAFAYESGATARASIGLGNVENTALSTWSGSTAITTLGTVATGTWQAGAIDSAYIDPTLSVTTITSSGAGTFGSIVVAGADTSTLVKGEIFVATGANALSQLTLGTNGQYLTVDTSTATGVKWSSIPGGSTTFDGLLDVSLSGTQSTNDVLKWNGTHWVDTDTLSLAGLTVASDLTLASGSITSASGAISFGNENLSTTGTFASGNATVTGTLGVTGTVTLTSGNLSLTSGSITASSGSVTSLSMRLTSTSDASLASTAHALQIGSTSGANLIADNNEIMARDNGATSTLILQGDGGQLRAGGDARVDGDLFIGATATSSNAQLYCVRTYSGVSGTDYGSHFRYLQSVATTGALRAQQVYVESTHTTGTVAKLIASRPYVSLAGAGGTVTLAVGTSIGGSVVSSAIATELRLLDIEVVTGGGTVTTGYSIYSASTYASYLAGSLRIGTTSAAGNELLRVNGLIHSDSDSIIIDTAKTPASAGATGTQGQVAWDADYIYVCTATDTWKRAALSTWP